MLINRRKSIKQIITTGLSLSMASLLSANNSKGEETMDDQLKHILNGKIINLENTILINKLQWKEHPVNKGVSLLHLITGNMTNGLFSSHLVKIDKSCSIAQHTHPDHYELHEVICGAGTVIMRNNEIEYKSGIMAVIPQNIEHSVHAKNENLYLMAKFFPALI